MIIRGNTLEYWKNNAEEDYLKVPISVLKYITILEEVAEREAIEAVDFSKWIDNNYFQGAKHNTYAKSREDFNLKASVFTINQLYEIFKRVRSETVA